MINEWIDVMTRLWGTIKDGRGGTVLSYSAFDKKTWPKKIEKFPSVITYATGVDVIYSRGGPCSLKWTGASDFHIVPDLSLEGIPVVMSYYNEILKIAAGNMKLKNKVTMWSIMPPEGGIKEAQFEYAEGPVHRGILVNWTVEETISGLITVSV